MLNRRFPSTPETPRPRRRVPVWALQSMCFTVFNPLGPQKRCVFSSLGRDGSKGQSCHVPGASWPPKSSHKGSKSFPFAVPFGVLVRRSCFLCFLCGFLEGPPLDPLARAQSKRSFSLFGVASKTISFSQQLFAHF